MYAPKKREKDEDDSESEDDVLERPVVQKPVEVDKTPVVQIDEEEIRRLTKYFEESRIEMEKVISHSIL